MCVFSFMAGRLSIEKKELDKEIKKYAKGAMAGDAAVRAYKLHKH